MRLKQRLLFFSIFVFAVSFPSLAPAKGGSGRQNHRLGAYLSMMSDPFPSFWGLNIGYNLTGFLRATASYGSLTIGTASVTGMNFGAKGFVPGWNLSPVVGVNYNVISSNVTSFIFSNVTINNAPGSNLNAFTINLGVDWQTDGGFLLGATYTLPVGNALWSGASSAGFYVGWFFL